MRKSRKCIGVVGEKKMRLGGRGKEMVERNVIEREFEIEPEK